METKLTLNIESNLAQTIKSYAMRNGCTLSGLVENYFFALVKNEEIKKNKQKTVDAFLNFASKNRKIEKEFIFNREECYDR